MARQHMYLPCFYLHHWHVLFLLSTLTDHRPVLPPAMVLKWKMTYFWWFNGTVIARSTLLSCLTSSHPVCRSEVHLIAPRIKEYSTLKIFSHFYITCICNDQCITCVILWWNAPILPQPSQPTFNPRNNVLFFTACIGETLSWCRPF